MDKKLMSNMSHVKLILYPAGKTVLPVNLDLELELELTTVEVGYCEIRLRYIYIYKKRKLCKFCHSQ